MSGNEEGDLTFPSITNGAVCSILATSALASLAHFAGEDPTARLTLFSFFLWDLAAGVKDREKVVGLLRVCADELERGDGVDNAAEAP